jgi:hypothetical protein
VDEIGGHGDPLVDRIREEFRDRLVGSARSTEVHQTSVELRQDSECAHVPSAGAIVSARRADGLRVVLIARVRQGEQRARVNEGAHALRNEA